MAKSEYKIGVNEYSKDFPIGSLVSSADIDGSNRLIFLVTGKGKHKGTFAGVLIGGDENFINLEQLSIGEHAFNWDGDNCYLFNGSVTLKQ